MILPREPATEKQINYIDILVVDLRMTIKQRNFYMSGIIHRKVEAPSDLNKGEASKVIQRFLQYKENEAPLQIKCYDSEDGFGENYDNEDIIF